MTSPDNPALPRTFTRFATTTAGPGTSGAVLRTVAGAAFFAVLLVDFFFVDLTAGAGASIAVTGRARLACWQGRNGVEQRGLALEIDAILSHGPALTIEHQPKGRSK